MVSWTHRIRGVAGAVHPDAAGVAFGRRGGGNSGDAQADRSGPEVELHGARHQAQEDASQEYRARSGCECAEHHDRGTGPERLESHTAPNHDPWVGEVDIVKNNAGLEGDEKKRG